jgi:hypothetical protein
MSLLGDVKTEAFPLWPLPKWFDTTQRLPRSGQGHAYSFDLCPFHLILFALPTLGPENDHKGVMKVLLKCMPNLEIENLLCKEYIGPLS